MSEPTQEPTPQVQPASGAATPGAGTSGASAPDAPTQETVDLAHALFDLARQGHGERLAAYVDAGAPVDLTDQQGNTLLMLAAYHGHPDLVRVLVERGADVDRLNDRGQSPVAGAVFKGDYEVVAVLLGHGADLDAGQPTARQTAEMFGRQDLLPGQVSD